MVSEPVEKNELYIGDVEILAGVAWKGYLQHGRGVVFVDRTKSEEKTRLSVDGDCSEWQAPACYIPAGPIHLHAGVSEISGMLDEYNPESEMVVAFRYNQEMVRVTLIAVDVKAAYENRSLELGVRSARLN